MSAPARASRRWLGGGLVAALAAVVVASVAAGDDTQATAPTTVVPASTTVPTAPAPAVTTTVPSVVRVGDGPLLGEATGLALLVTTGDQTFRVDLDAATVTRLGRSVSDVRQTASGVVYRDTDGPELQLRRPGRGSATGLGDARYLGDGPADRAWFATFGPNARRLWSEDLTGAIVDVELPAGTGYGVPDDLGGLLIPAPGGTYRWLAGEGVRRISGGAFVVAGGGRALVHECDEALACSLVSLDLRTGQRRTVPTVSGVRPDDYGHLSPDGYLFAVPAGDDRFVAVSPDGRGVDLGPVDSPCLSVGCPNGPRWSPDDRWVVWTRGVTSIMAWRAGLAAPIRLETVEAGVRSASLATAASDPGSTAVAVGTLDAFAALDGVG